MADDESARQASEDAAPTFEEALRKLEEIVRRLEEGNLTLDESLRLYEEGIAAFQRCQTLLGEAELKVRKLVETLDGDLKEEPFEGPAQ
ncbi:MAG: exodeoxyribonuclease VII small subunit [Candidatus Brocadiaceae bacterium]|nr:exodeoxyribonuclease VII small subunit [Candidatus Brocadiaceae bacterium]